MSRAHPITNDLHHDDFQDASHFTNRGYLTGFAAAAVLTIVPFWLVMARPIANAAVAGSLVVVLAFIQILVHTFAFLHVNARAQAGWTLVAYIFTAVIVLITIGGSLWIMHHLNLNMMPGMGEAIDRGM